MTQNLFVSAAASAIILLTIEGTQAQTLSGDEIKSTIGDRTVILRTSLGSMPLTYANSGTVTGDGSGTGLGRFFAPKESGSWWVDGDNMCQKFETWYKGRTFCFSLESSGEDELKWTRDDGYSGTAVIQ